MLYPGTAADIYIHTSTQRTEIRLMLVHRAQEVFTSFSVLCM